MMSNQNKSSCPKFTSLLVSINRRIQSCDLQIIGKVIGFVENTTPRTFRQLNRKFFHTQNRKLDRDLLSKVIGKVCGKKSVVKFS